MSRICFEHPYINVAQGSVDKATGASSSVPEFGPGQKIRCDSGVYRYLQANGAVIEGGICKYIPAGSTWDATPFNTSTSAQIPTDCAVCVTSGGLSDNQWGWFWIGDGEDYVYATSTITSFLQVTTWTSAGQVAVGSGDNISDLVAIGSTTASGLRLMRSTRLLATNFTTHN